jgi:hypothetical protein
MYKYEVFVDEGGSKAVWVWGDIGECYLMDVHGTCNKLNEQHKIIQELQLKLQIIGNVAGEALIVTQR